MSKESENIGEINKFIFSLIQKSINNQFKKNVLNFYERGFYDCFLQVCYNHLIPELRAHYLSNSGNISKFSKSFSSHALSVIYKNGRISVFLSRLTINSYLKFIYKWSVVLLYILKPLASGRNSNITNGIIVFGLPIGQLMTVASDQPITDFFKETNVKPLNSSATKFVQCPTRISVDESLFSEPYISLNQAKHYFHNQNHRYAVHPELDFISKVKLGFWKRVRLFFNHLLSFFKAHLYMICISELRIMIDELAYYWTMKSLDSMKKIDAVIFTNSSYLKQPLWLWNTSEIEVHYFHYSTAPLQPIKANDRSKYFAALELQSLFVAPAKHWVWRETDKEILENHYFQKNVEVVGIPSFSFKINDIFKKKNIVIFDVNPVAETRNKQLGIFDSYFTEQRLIDFMTNIIECVTNISSEKATNYDIILKRKRSHVHRDMINYYEAIMNLQRKNKNFTITTNYSFLNSQLNKDTICIGIPFNSASFAIATLGVTSIFFDPDGQLLNPYDTMCNRKEPNIYFCQSKSTLFEMLQKKL